MVAEVTVYSQTRDGTLAYEWAGVDQLRYSDVLNRPGACTFRLPNAALPSGAPLETVLEPGVHEVGVRRADRTVWLGPLLTADEEPYDSPGFVAFGCEGLMTYARRWHVEAPIEGATTAPTPGPDGDDVPAGHLEQIEQTEILARLIEHHQAKPGGEVFALDTSAITPTGVLRDRTYNPEELPVIYDLWVALGEVEDGFDHDIDPETRQVRTYYPRRGRRRRDVALTERNVRSMRRQIDATSQASQTIGLGAGEGPDQLRTAVMWNRPLQTYGLTQRVYTNKDVSIASTLREQTWNEHLRHRWAPQTFEAEVAAATVERFTLGDIVRMTYTSGYSGEPRFGLPFRRVVAIEHDPAAGVARLTLEPDYSWSRYA